MKIVHLVAGAGKMYCGSCLAGNTLCRALQQAGHDVVLVPVYTPIRTDEENVSVDRVALGGLNVFLQQQSRLARRMPGFVDRVLDHPALLGRLGGGTRPERLGPLAVSMLRGEEGNQQKEVDKLVDWLDREIHPELIHLSTALLVGAA
ncbi:MAG: glycosyltransferase family 1 protein, partial [Pirellulales bacterium]|nr:glycosyltransferase family 1 protein [Pirellulales bacterium]